MTLLEALLVLAAGVAAGTINTVVGSGTLITFPVLLALGYAPVTANVSNNVGLVPGSVSGALGMRPELAGQRARLLRLGSASVLGGVIGAVLLLVLPGSAFRAIVPALIAVALVLVLIQPWLAHRLADRHDRPLHGGPLVWLGVLGAGVYGGYFGAAQGVLLVGLLGSTLADDLHRINATKNVLAGTVNAVAAVVFVVAAHVAWLPAALIAAGSTVGGQIGARTARRLPPWGLRALLVVVGTVAMVRLI
jgi:uncharacterized membrane protein YfcA